MDCIAISCVLCYNNFYKHINYSPFIPNFVRNNDAYARELLSYTAIPGSLAYIKELKEMTIRELYTEIGGDYDQAVRVLRVDKLIDKHIRRFTQNGAAERLFEAGKSMDPAELFEAAHAMKGVCANLGLTSLSEAASEIAEEFRPGNQRKLSDAEVSAKLARTAELYKKTEDGIRKYEEG